MMPLYEKSFYVVLIVHVLFSAVPLQKSVSDRMEGIRVTNLYYGLACILVRILSVLLGSGLWNATLTTSASEMWLLFAYGIEFLAMIGMISLCTVEKSLRYTKSPPIAYNPTNSSRSLSP